jgi:phage-related protein
MSEQAYTIRYYSANVKAAIKALPKGVFAAYIKLTMKMQLIGPNLGLPKTKSLGSGLFEIRADAAEGWGRVFYCTMKDKQIVMLHSFLKKTNATPPRERETAERRMREVKNGTVHPIG